MTRTNPDGMREIHWLDRMYEQERDALTEDEWRDLFAVLRAHVDKNIAIVQKRNELHSSGRNYVRRRDRDPR